MKLGGKQKCYIYSFSRIEVNVHGSVGQSIVSLQNLKGHLGTILGTCCCVQSRTFLRGSFSFYFR